MNWKNGILLALISGLVSGGICLLYSLIYYKASYTDFSQVVTPAAMFISSLVGTLLMSVGYILIGKWNKTGLYPIANILYSAVSFGSTIGVITYTLPMEIEAPEMFPALAIPMHFFPIMSFLSLAPFFLKFQSSK